jgi:carboxypeptidase C (cathepsin A)
MFFDKYQIFKGNDFIIAGESYAGIYIPRLAEKILYYNEGA